MTSKKSSLVLTALVLFNGYTITMLNSTFMIASAGAKEYFPCIKLRTVISKSKRDDLEYYLRKIDRHIRRNWDPPRSCEHDYSPLFQFTITAQGKVESILVITKSSSNFDSSVIKALHKSEPFPQIPGGIGDIQVTCKFSYFELLSKPPRFE